MCKDEKFQTTHRQIQIPKQTRKDDYLFFNINDNHLNRRLLLVMDRTFLAGFTGTCASIGLGQVHAIVGIIAGLATIVYMSIKIYELLKKWNHSSL